MTAPSALSSVSARVLVREGVRRLRHPRGDRTQAGWATESLEEATRTALLLGMTGWQCLLAVTAFVSLSWGRDALLLGLGHATFAVLAWLTWRREWSRGWIVLGAHALFLVDWAAAPSTLSALLFGAWWMVELANCYTLDGPWWRVPLVLGVLIVPVGMIVTGPDVPAVIPLSYAAFALGTTPGVRVGYSFIIDYAHGIDADTRELESATVDLQVRRAAIGRLAEDARQLHDTAINTLGVIANGGAGVRDEDAVRRRCLEDADVMATVRSEEGDDDADRRRLRELIRPVGIRVRYAGLADDAVAEVESALAPPVLRALGQAAAEAVQNAAKHSGCDEVVVTIDRVDDRVLLEVRDDGVGTDQAPPPGRGVQRSILDRAAEAGIEADFDSAPGRGTTVTLRCPLDGLPATPAPVVVDTADVDTVLWQVRTRAAALIAAGFGLIPLFITVVSHGLRPTPDWLMLCLVAATSGLAVYTNRQGRLPAWVAGVWLVAGPLAFLASGSTVDFGRDQPLQWHSVAAVSPVLALCAIASIPLVRGVALAGYLATAVVVAVAVSATSSEAAAVVAVAASSGLCITLGVRFFVGNMTTVVARAVDQHNARFAVDVESAAVDAADKARRRWQRAGTDQSVELLRAIGTGDLDPRDPVVQARCGEQEQFLRQLTTLDPQLTQMGTWFAHALSAARERGVGLTVRAGSTDAPADRAGELGRAVLAVIDALPGGTTLTASLFATSRGLSMTLVAPTPHLVSALGSADRARGGMSVQSIGGQDLVEIAFEAPGSPAAATSGTM